jgi:ABC-type branched-subunit amino acid transport system substrate-binding protein
MGIMVLVVLIISLLAMFGCGTKTTPTTAVAPPPSTSVAPPPSTSVAPPPSSSVAPPPSSSATTAASQTLTIGAIFNLQNAMGLEEQEGVQCMMDIANNKGGLTIGGVNYKLKLLTYDDKNDQATTVAAANRLIFQDHVKYIVHDPQLVESYIPITEANKTILIGGTPSQATVKPGLNYSCFGSGTNFTFPISFAWFVKNYPDAAKTYVFVAPDDQNGHFSTQFFGGALVALGVTPQYIFYPASATDLSAVATKVMTLKPTNIDCTGGGDIQDDQALKACYAAGYKGIFFTGGGGSASTLKEFLPAAALTQYMSTAIATDLTPTPNQMAKDLMAAYTARFGKWDAPGLQVDDYNCLIGGMIKADSIDPDAIMKVIYKGLKYTTLNGSGMMVSRPDLGDTGGNTRDSCCTILIKSFQDGNPILKAQIDPADGINYYIMSHKGYVP